MGSRIGGQLRTNCMDCGCFAHELPRGVEDLMSIWLSENKVIRAISWLSFELHLLLTYRAGGWIRYCNLIWIWEEILRGWILSTILVHGCFPLLITFPIAQRNLNKRQSETTKSSIGLYWGNRIESQWDGKWNLLEILSKDFLPNSFIILEVLAPHIT